MEVRASWRFVARPAKAAAPALAAFLVTGAGVAAIAQPIAPSPEPAPPPAAHPFLPPEKPATIRIILPPPAPLAFAKHRRPVEPLGFSPHRPEPAAQLVSVVAAPPKALSMAPATTLVPAIASAAPVSGLIAPTIGAAEAPPHPVSARPVDAPQRTPRAATPAKFAASKNHGDAEYSAAVRTTSAKPAPTPIPMVDAESRASVARMYGGDDFAPGPAERLDALQPAPPSPRALVDSAAMREARPVGMSPTPMQPEETIGKYRRTSQGLAFEVSTSVNGTPAGKVSLLISDGENISVRLADLLKSLQPSLDAALYQKLSGSQAAQSFVTFNELRASGIAVRFSDNDQLILGTR